MRRGAFTLLELLIVVAVISALTAVTIPTIQKAQTSARRTTCAEQIRALLLSANVYAQGHSGSFPPGPREMPPDGTFAGDPDRGSPIQLFSADRIGRADYSSQNGWYSHGLLWQSGALDQPRAFYCPEMERRGWGFAGTWPQHWDAAPDRAGEKPIVTSSYAYRGGYASAAGAVNGPLNLYRTFPGEPVFVDSPLFGTMVHPGGYTVGFFGGQTEFFASTKPLVTGTALGPLWDAVRQDPPAPAPAP